MANKGISTMRNNLWIYIVHSTNSGSNNCDKCKGCLLQNLNLYHKAVQIRMRKAYF